MSGDATVEDGDQRRCGGSCEPFQRSAVVFRKLEAVLEVVRVGRGGETVMGRPGEEKVRSKGWEEITLLW